jgi:hypothetical protein
MARKSETDLNRYDWTRATRGKYVEKARRSLEVIVIDKKSAKALGGPDAIRRILQTLAESIEPRRKKRRAAA